MTARIQLSDPLCRALLNPSALPSELVLNQRRYLVEEPVASGYKAVVWKVRDDFGRARAAKLAIPEDYQDHSYLAEVRRATALEPHSCFATLIDAGPVEVSLNEVGVTQFVCFVEEWIDGLTLRSFLGERGREVTASFLLAYVDGLAAALNALRANELRHDDLHSGNVMIGRPPAGDLDGTWQIKVIDMGSLKSAATPLAKPYDDHLNFVRHIIDIVNALRARRNLTAYDHRLVGYITSILRAMVDEDLTIALRDPQQILQQFQLAALRAENVRTDEPPRLQSPFEYISAEHIGDDRILLAIFAESCPWLERVAGPDPCLVTGPRGCGKSTIFRWLSLRTQLCSRERDLSSLSLIGFYISCSIDLQNRLGWITSEGLANRFRREIVHYFNLVALREVLRTLEFLAQRTDLEPEWRLGRAQERSLHRFLTTAVNFEEPIRIQGVSILAQLRELTEQEMVAAHSQMIRGLNLSYTTSEAFLGDLTTRLAQLLPACKSRKIAFLLDDFSTHRLPASVQVVLNRIVWERRPSHVFKLSAEKYGAVLQDPHRATADLSREMVEVDCGREFIALDERRAVARARRFFLELIDHRLQSANYAGRAEQLLGHSPSEALGRALTRRGRGRSQGDYFGIARLADLCSGDVSQTLLVCRRIFEAANITVTSTSQIQPAIQDTAVRQVSRELLESIQAYFPHGSEMYSIVSVFGNLVRRILEDGAPQRKGKSLVPAQCPRIEIDQSQGAVLETIQDTHARELMRELVRRSIFIDMGPGLSRHKQVLTLRWHLRRIYLPAFGAALAKNDAVKEGAEWLRFFLTEPAGACGMIWDRWPKAQRKPAPHNEPLFGGQG